MPRAGTRASEPGSPNASSAMSIARSRASANDHASSLRCPATFIERCYTRFPTLFTSACSTRSSSSSRYCTSEEIPSCGEDERDSHPARDRSDEERLRRSGSEKPSGKRPGRKTAAPKRRRSFRRPTNRRRCVHPGMAELYRQKVTTPLEPPTRASCLRKRSVASSTRSSSRPPQARCNPTSPTAVVRSRPKPAVQRARFRRIERESVRHAFGRQKRNEVTGNW